MASWSFGTNTAAPQFFTTWAGTRSTSDDVSTILTLRAGGGQRCGHRESVSPREVYVKEYPVWARSGYSGKRLVTVRGLIDELETAFGEQLSGRSAEVRVVVNNQDPLAT